MTGRVNALVVTLHHDLRIDDAGALIDAIKQLRGVIDVQGHIADTTALIAEARADNRWRERLLKVINERP